MNLSFLFIYKLSLASSSNDARKTVMIMLSSKLNSNFEWILNSNNIEMQNRCDHEDQEHRPYSFSNVQTLYTTLWWYPKANTETRFESLSSIYPAVTPTIYLAMLSIYTDIYLCHITWPYFQLCQAKHISGCATCPQLSINMLYSTTFWTENVTISPISVWVIKKPPCHCWKMSLLA